MIYPPRPEKAVDPSELPRYENPLQWWAQVKKNGSYTVEKTLLQHTLLSYTRHRTPHSLWEPRTSKALEPIRDMTQPGTLVCGELLHSKVKGGHRDVIYLHDIIIAGERDLFGETYEDRYALLLDIFKPMDQGDLDHFVVSEHLWIAKNILREFTGIFRSLTDPEDEGLVLKNPKARLMLCNREGSNSGWQVKVRRPLSPNYSF